MKAAACTRTEARASARSRDFARDNFARSDFARLRWIPLHALVFAAVLCWAFAGTAFAGNQQYEPMSASVRSALIAAVSDRGAPEPRFVSMREKVDWLATMSERLPRKWKPDLRQRVEFLKTVRYEAQRAGLDPHLVLGLIEVESYFRRYAVSSAGARGYMQVMPFWTDVIGDRDASRLFDMRANLRYGCAILRHYIDLENGDLFRALGRYNGSLGRPEYPNAVLRAWKKWEYGAPQRVVSARAERPPG
ncbi:MAG: lytic transglycosylase domain-containing protein [Burkholderiaceae bacterium]|nr:lytic transglycosylase domain-containing protein [Burkholderiaceae bacterium]